nr:hypothetical protein [Haladaptatus halobius]
MSNKSPDENESDAEIDRSQVTDESCKICGEETQHQISIELITENEDSDNDEFSREPYRITECQQCGEISKQRMNDV